MSYSQRVEARRGLSSTSTRLRRAIAVSRAARFTGGPEHVAQPDHDGATRQPDAYVGQPGVPADDVDEPAGDPDRLLRLLGDEEDRVAERLDHPAVVGCDHVGAAGLEDLDELAEPV